MSQGEAMSENEPARHLAYCWRVARGASWRRSHMVSAAVASGRLGSEEMRVGRPSTVRG